MRVRAISINGQMHKGVGGNRKPSLPGDQPAGIGPLSFASGVVVLSCPEIYPHYLSSLRRSVSGPSTGLSLLCLKNSAVNHSETGFIDGQDLTTGRPRNLKSLWPKCWCHSLKPSGLLPWMLSSCDQTHLLLCKPLPYACKHRAWLNRQQ